MKDITVPESSPVIFNCPINRIGKVFPQSQATPECPEPFSLPVNLCVLGREFFLTTGAMTTVGQQVITSDKFFPCPKSSPNILPNFPAQYPPFWSLNSFDIQNPPVLYFGCRKRNFYYLTALQLRWRRSPSRGLPTTGMRSGQHIFLEQAERTGQSWRAHTGWQPGDVMVDNFQDFIRSEPAASGQALVWSICQVKHRSRHHGAHLTMDNYFFKKKAFYCLNWFPHPAIYHHCLIL